MDCHHITIASESRSNAFPDVKTRRRATALLVRVAGPSVALFCVVDDHVHLVLAADRAQAGRVAQAVGAAFTHAFPSAGFDAARIRPVKDRRHCQSLVPYVLRQTDHHGLACHAALWEGSCFMDLVGARHLAGFTRQPLQRLLPRLRDEDIWRAVDLTSAPQIPTGDLRGVGLAALIEASTAAFGVCRLGSCKLLPSMAAKRVAVLLGRRADSSTAQLAAALAVSRSTVNRLAADSVPEHHVAAALLQLSLRRLPTSRARAA